MSMMFCRGCGKEIHESAPTCPHCEAPQGNPLKQGKTLFASYDQVPWYRKNWFAVVCMLIFTPGLLLILSTGDIYYESEGQLKTYSKGAKITLITLSVFYILLAVLRAGR
ncbi:MAG: hypothetical protein ACD_23C00666G0003 [uncultured bacterium]|nr:MAG: hypothetical protein ACD_23C00666G0003 [uncultured bacterium]